MIAYRGASICLAFVLLCLSAGIVAAQQPVGTAFTYQGKLTGSGGAPLNGSYDMQFKLFGASAGSNQIGSTVNLSGVAVSNGLFTVKLDFGTEAFDGSARWLEVSVGSEVMGPRVEITPAPYALCAATVASNTRTVTGRINAKGQIVWGTGFTVVPEPSPPYPGLAYWIVFDVPFPNGNYVLLNSSATMAFYPVGATVQGRPEAGRFLVSYTWQSEEDEHDFSFSAIGDVCASTATCSDSAKNGRETDVDCGGAFCQPCADGKSCLVPADCQSRVCTNGQCAAPTCNDMVKNGYETDVDCGGPSCARCADGNLCVVGGDCASGICEGGQCAAPTCFDTVKNGGESDVDCGGPECPKCVNGKQCSLAGDCVSGKCVGGTCQP